MSSGSMMRTGKRAALATFMLLCMLAFIPAALAASFSGSSTLTPSTGTGLSINLIEPDDEHYKSGDTPSFRYLVAYNKSLQLGCNLNIDGSTKNSVTISDGQEEVSSLSLSLSEGAHSWNVNCADAKNNSDTSSTSSFTVDLTDPSISLKTPNPTVSLIDSISLNFTATDNLADTLSCDLDINGALNQSGISVSSGVKKSVTLSNLDNGTYTWQTTCEDEAGNSEESATHTFYIDTKRNFSVTPNKNAYDIGEGGLFIVTAPYGGSVTVLITDPKSDTITREFDDTFPVFSDMDFLDHPGTYTLDGFLNYNGAVKTTSSSFTVQDSFTADITVNATTVAKGQTVTFIARGDGGIGDMEYRWDFGDSETATGKEVSHSYSSLGTYTAELTITDGEENEAKETVSISVEDRHTLSVVVRDRANRNALADASVYIEGNKKTTGSTGRVTYELFGDDYGVLVSHPDYTSVFNRTTIRDATTLNVYLSQKNQNVTLEPAPQESQTEEEEQTTDTQDQDSGLDSAEAQGIRERAGVMLSDVNDALGRLEEVSSEERHLVDRLRIKDRLENARLNLQRVDRDLHNLEDNRRGLSEEEIAKQKQEIEQDVAQLEETTISSISIIESSSTERYAGTREIGELSDTYLDIMNITPKRSVRKDYVEQNIELQSAVSVSSVVQTASVRYLSGERETITVVSDSAEINGEVGDAKYVVSIPKELAQSVTEMELLTSHEVLQEDPMVAFDLANTPEITYYFRKDIPEDQIGRIQSGLLNVPDRSMHDSGGLSITGLAIFSSLSDIDNPIIVLEVLAIIILLGIYLVYEFDLWDRTRKLFLFSNKELKQVRDIMEDIEACLEHNEPDNGAVEYQDLMEEYKKLSKSSKKRVYKEIEEMHYKILMSQLNHYIDEALANIDEKKVEVARKQYAEIQSIYKQLPKTHKAIISNRCAILLSKLGAQ